MRGKEEGIVTTAVQNIRKVLILRASAITSISLPRLCPTYRSGPTGDRIRRCQLSVQSPKCCCGMVIVIVDNGRLQREGIQVGRQI